MDPPAFDWARAAVLYDGLGRSLVLSLKHGGRVAAVPVMSQMICGSVMGMTETGLRPDLIIPVPLHPTRLAKRRFNQSQLLAADLARHLALPLDSFSLKKIRSTESQGGLNRAERFRNVATSFAIDPRRKSSLAGKTIVLVDDVMTTGATASACAKVLKKAGARSVGVVTFARVGRPVAG